jgi:hypothetical protein
LDVRIKIASNIKDDFLLEGIVKDEPQRVQAVLKDDGHEGERKQRRQMFRMMLLDDIVDNEFGRRGKNDQHQCAHDRATHHPERERGIAFEILKDAPGRFHFSESSVRWPKLQVPTAVIPSEAKRSRGIRRAF